MRLIKCCPPITSQCSQMACWSPYPYRPQLRGALHRFQQGLKFDCPRLLTHPPWRQVGSQQTLDLVSQQAPLASWMHGHLRQRRSSSNTHQSLSFSSSMQFSKPGLVMRCYSILGLWLQHTSPCLFLAVNNLPALKLNHLKPALQVWPALALASSL